MADGAAGLARRTDGYVRRTFPHRNHWTHPHPQGGEEYIYIYIYVDIHMQNIAPVRTTRRRSRSNARHWSCPENKKRKKCFCFKARNSCCSKSGYCLLFNNNNTFFFSTADHLSCFGQQEDIVSLFLFKSKRLFLLRNETVFLYDSTTSYKN